VQRRGAPALRQLRRGQRRQLRVEATIRSVAPVAAFAKQVTERPQPTVVAMLTSAPSLASSSTVSVRPFSAAINSGVAPSCAARRPRERRAGQLTGVRQLIDARALRMEASAAVRPLRAASWSAVLPPCDPVSQHVMSRRSRQRAATEGACGCEHSRHAMLKQPWLTHTSTAHQRVGTEKHHETTSRCTIYRHCRLGSHSRHSMADSHDWYFSNH
jgi:hypothetical protein